MTRFRLQAKAQCSEFGKLQSQILDACKDGNKEEILDLINICAEKKRMHMVCILLFQSFYLMKRDKLTQSPIVPASPEGGSNDACTGVHLLHVILQESRILGYVSF